MAAEREAFEKLKLAGQLDGLEWNETDANWGEYSSLWLDWSGENPDAASEACERWALQSLTPPAPAPAPSTPLNRADRVGEGSGSQQVGDPRAGRQPPITLDAITTELRRAVEEGASQTDLAALVPDLAQRGDRTPSSIWPILKAITAESGTTASIQAEAHALAVEADRRDLGASLTVDYLLPPVLAAATEAVTRFMPIDGPAQALLTLGMIAGLCKLGTTVTGIASSGYTVPVNLYFCLIGPSGSMKSPPLAAIVGRPTQPLIENLVAENRRRRKDFERACAELKKGDARPEEPKGLVVHTADFTGEALALQLATHEMAGLGLLIFTDELSGVFTSLNAYRKGRGRDEQLLLELFDGNGSRSLRCSGNREFSRSQVSIVGCTQPDVLQSLVANGDPSGLWARFMFAPLPQRIVRLRQDTPEEVAEVRAAGQALEDFAKRAYCLAPMPYRLDPDAQKAFIDFQYQRQAAGQTAQLGAQQAVYGKSAGKVLRVAGAMHVASIVAGETDKGDLDISVETINRAIMLVDCLDIWALSMHAQVAAAGDGSTGVMKIVHRASEALGRPVGWADIRRRLSPKQRGSIDGGVVAAAMEALAEGGWGRLSEGVKGARLYQAIKALP